MNVKVSLLLLPCLTAATMAPVSDADSDASGTTNFESFGSFGGFQGMSQLHGLAGFSDLEGQFDSSGFDREFGQNRRHDTGLDDFGALTAAPKPAAPRTYHAGATKRIDRPSANVYSIEHHGLSPRPHLRPAAPVHAPGAHRPAQTFAGRPHAFVAVSPPSGGPRPIGYSVASVQSLLSAGQTPAYNVRPAAGVQLFTAARQAYPVAQNRFNPQRLAVVHADPVVPTRGFALHPQESSNTANKHQHEFHRQLGSGFGSDENHGFDFGADGF